MEAAEGCRWNVCEFTEGLGGGAALHPSPSLHLHPFIGSHWPLSEVEELFGNISGSFSGGNSFSFPSTKLQFQDLRPSSPQSPAEEQQQQQQLEVLMSQKVGLKTGLICPGDMEKRE